MIPQGNRQQARASEAGRVLAAHQLRATHPSAHRSGKWARVVERLAGGGGPPTVVVVYDDGTTHRWVADDLSMLYEVRGPLP